MQVRHVAIALALCARAYADGDVAQTAAAPPRDDLDLRLTLSSFIYRESGDDAAATAMAGATLQNASPVHRFFGDLRLELGDAGLAVDARVRQTTSATYQSGAESGGEYELRTLSYRIGPAHTHVTIGRQFIDPVGATKIDGLAFTQSITDIVDATAFVGLFPQLGSRSVDTDYIHVQNADGTTGALMLPIVGGVGISYTTPAIHGDLGVAGVYVAQDVPNATSDQKTRVFAASSGYWRPVSALDIYHFAMLDVAGGNGVNLTNGSVGVDARPVSSVQFTFAYNHVSTDLLQIAARNFLTDPDPTAIGLVQNNIALLRISQDMARVGASVALDQRRFELSAMGGLHLRPAVSVELADGTGAVSFPEARSADATLVALDRRSIANTRISISGSLTEPIGHTVPNRSRGLVGRLVVEKPFGNERGSLEADLMVEHFNDLGSPEPCTTSVSPFACYGTATTTAGQAGALVSWRVAKEWLVIADAHVGYQQINSRYLVPMDPTDPSSPLVDLPVAWPTVVSVTGFLRLQWRYR
jgi:hypothetical protein